MEGVAYSDMAIILRAHNTTATAIRRALGQSAIPVAGDREAIAANAAIAPFLLLARVAAGSQPLNLDTCERLLLSEFGGATSISLRRIRTSLLKARDEVCDPRTGTQMIIDAIDSGGEEAIRVNDIAADAGVTVPTLYRHFGSRDGLVEAAQTYRFRKTQFVDSSVLAASLAKCKNRDDLQKALRKELLSHFDTDRWELRQVRLNALGSGYARPELTASLALAQKQGAMGIVEMLQPFQQKGWIRKDIDLAATVYWFMGQILGRVLIEMGDNPVSQKKWNDISLEGIMAVIFGDNPKK
jgi:AcrR family transcriptional regulator